jgi:O-succinylbenzoic acid--CoA ligase
VITNDLVNIVDSTHFTWLGRVDNVINSGGIKISPERIEKALELIFEEEKLTNRFFIAGVADHTLGERLVLFVEGNAFRQEIQRRVLNTLSERISKFELPKEVKFISVFSETKSGKVNRVETVTFYKKN